MRRMFFISQELQQKVYLLHDAAELLCAFNSDYVEHQRASMSDTEHVRGDRFNYAESVEKDLAYFYRIFLNTATLYNHTDLVSLLLADARCNSESLLGDYPSPLLTAIEKKNVGLVDAFLRAHSSLNVLTLHDVSRHDHWVPISALAYACDCDEPAIVNRLVSYYIQQYPPRDPGKSKISYAATTPLHIIIKSLCKSSLRSDKCSLLEIVQHFIEAGGDINECDFKGCSPLLLLIKKVRNSMLNYPNKLMMNSVVVIDTVRVMLAAGALAQGSRMKKNPLDILIDLTESFPENMLCVPSFHFKRYHFVMLVDLMNILLQHGATISAEVRSEKGNYFTSCPGHIRIIRNATKLVKLYKNYFSDPKYLALCTCAREMRDTFAGLMDSMADILRSFILVAGGVNDFCACEHIKYRKLCAAFDFIKIVEYSTQVGNSAQLMRVVLDTLGAYKGNFMRKILLINLELTKKNSPEKSREHIEKALELITGRQAPFFLQRLARTAVLRAMSFRCLSGTSALEIPEHLKQYLLLRDN